MLGHVRVRSRVDRLVVVELDDAPVTKHLELEVHQVRPARAEEFLEGRSRDTVDGQDDVGEANASLAGRAAGSDPPDRDPSEHFGEPLDSGKSRCGWMSKFPVVSHAGTPFTKRAALRPCADAGFS